MPSTDSAYSECDKNDNWKDTEIGYLKEFYSSSRKNFSDKRQFRQAFIKEKVRQWELRKKIVKIEKSYNFLSSSNAAAIGNRLQSNYVPKPNDATVLFEVGKRLAKLSSDTKDLINAINEDDQSLFDKQGRHLKTSHSQFGHEKNLVFCKELTALNASIAKLEEDCKKTAALFWRVTGDPNRDTNSALKKKNSKKIRRGWRIDLSIMLKSYLFKFAAKIFVVYMFLGALFLILKLQLTGKSTLILQNQNLSILSTFCNILIVMLDALW